MKYNAFTLTAVLFVACLFAACDSGTDDPPADPPAKPVYVKFHVRNAATGAPMAGVTITREDIVPPFWSGVTDANGNLDYGERYAGSLHFLISETDYLDVREFVQVDDSLAYDTISLVNPNEFVVASYKFSNNVADSSGYGHHGTNHGASFVSDRFNNPSSALSFNGSTDYVSVPDAARLNLGKKDFAISVWVKESSAQTAPSAYFVNKSKSNPFIGYKFGRDEEYLATHIGTTTYQTSLRYATPFSPDGRWHHVVVVIDRQGNGKYYIDGDFYREAPLTNIDESIDVTADLLIGGIGSPTSAYKGALDDIKIYPTRLEARHVSKVYHENGW